jgi:hypothetical protein
MGANARMVFARERGAVRRTMILIERIYARRRAGLDPSAGKLEAGA